AAQDGEPPAHGGDGSSDGPCLRRHPLHIPLLILFLLWTTQERETSQMDDQGKCAESNPKAAHRHHANRGPQYRRPRPLPRIRGSLLATSWPRFFFLIVFLVFIFFLVLPTDGFPADSGSFLLFVFILVVLIIFLSSAVSFLALAGGFFLLLFFLFVFFIRRRRSATDPDAFFGL